MFHCAFVAVEDTAPVFDQLYSYIVPEELAASARVGSRVTVPFGRSDAVRTGMIMRISEEESPEYRLKTIIDVEAGESPVSEDIVDLIEFLKQKTYCTY